MLLCRLVYFLFCFALSSSIFRLLTTTDIQNGKKLEKTAIRIQHCGYSNQMYLDIYLCANKYTNLLSITNNWLCTGMLISLTHTRYYLSLVQTLDRCTLFASYAHTQAKLYVWLCVCVCVSLCVSFNIYNSSSLQCFFNFFWCSLSVFPYA